MEELDAIEGLEAAIERACKIAKYHGKVLDICKRTVRVLEKYGPLDTALNDECPETQRNV